MSVEKYSQIVQKLSSLIDTNNFKSVSLGRIRDIIAVSQMPSIDIAVVGHEVQDEHCNPVYIADLQILVCVHGYQRTARNIDVQDLAYNICKQIEFQSGQPVYDVLRNINVTIQNDGEAADSGSSVRKALITGKIYY